MMNAELINFLLESTGWASQLWTDAGSILILAQAEGAADAAPAQGAQEGFGNLFVQFFNNPLNLILISAILFMFIVARPQQKALKEQQKMLAELKKNDRIVTASGIHGIVVQNNPEEPFVIIRIDENSGARMTINRDTISKVTPSDSKD